MSKNTDNLRKILLETAKKQIKENGYKKTTIRSVASECGIAVGTVYNYFESKDMLIAGFVSEEWHKCLKKMQEQSTDEPKALLGFIYDTLTKFTKKNKALFADADAAKVFSVSFSTHHGMLRDQLAEIIKPACKAKEDDEFTAQFIAEALLTWTRAKVPFDRIYALIQKLIYS